MKLDHLHRLRDQIAHLAHQLNDDTLADLLRRGDRSPGRDGFPATAGTGAPGSATSTSVEAASLAGLPGDTEDDQRLDDWADHQLRDDVGLAICEMYANLTEIAGLAIIVDRKLAYILNVGDMARGRQDSTAGSCCCCYRPVAGTENDRLRAGYCMACNMAWSRAGRPDRYQFEQSRRTELGILTAHSR